MIPPDRLKYPEPILFGRFPLAEATTGGMAIRDHPEGRSYKGPGGISPVSLVPMSGAAHDCALHSLCSYSTQRSSDLAPGPVPTGVVRSGSYFGDSPDHCLLMLRAIASTPFE